MTHPYLVSRAILLSVLSATMMACGGSEGTAPITAASIVTISATVGGAARNTVYPVFPTVRVLDASGNPVVSEWVTFAVTAGGGQIERPSIKTDANGEASAGSWTLGAAGPQRLEARVGSLSPAVFSVTAYGLDPVVDIFAFHRHTCGLTQDGIAFCWGDNGFGQVGVGQAVSNPTKSPVPVLTKVRFATLAGGESHTCGLTAAGEQYCWGSSGYGEHGDNWMENRLTPVRITTPPPFIDIAANDLNTCGLTAAGAIYCSGETFGGRTDTQRLVSGGETFVKLYRGFRHTCALKASGAAWCWGWNYADSKLVTGEIDGGQLGDGTRTTREEPAPVLGGLSFTSMALGGAHSCALTADGKAYCWGLNSSGQLGDGSTTERLIPTEVSTAERFISLTAGAFHTCGVSTSAQAFCWGANSFGQLGTGDNQQRVVPTAAAGAIRFSKLTSQSYHTCGRTDDAKAYCWGQGEFGALGDGQQATTSNAVKVMP